MEVIIKKHKKLTPKRIILSAVIAIVLVGIIAVLGISIYVGRGLTHPARSRVTENPVMYELMYEDITFKSRLDQISLSGWWIPSQKNKKVISSDKTVIFSHGYGDSRDLQKIHVLGVAKSLAERGFNVLLFDFRNSGKSEGSVTGVGYFEKHDLLSAIDYAKGVKKSKEIDLIGWSMGASTSIMAGMESPDVKVVIADSPFADLTDYLNVNLPVWSNLPNFPFTPIIMKVIPVIDGIKTDEVSPYKAVKNIGGRKLLLIHSKADGNIPYNNSMAIYDAVPDKSKAELWITDKAGHIMSYLMYKDEYEKKIAEFLMK